MKEEKDLVEEDYEIILRHRGASSESAFRVKRKKEDDGEEIVLQIKADKGKILSRAKTFLEFSIQQDIRSENVLRVFKQYVVKNLLLVETEYTNGGSLLDLFGFCLGRKKLLSFKQIWGIFLQLLKGIDDIHSQSIIHLNIKPETVLLSVSSRKIIPKISDFSLSCFFDEGYYSSSYRGTVLYSSPESIGLLNRSYEMKDIPFFFSNKSDMFGLGVVLFELVTFCYPFFYKTYGDILHSIFSCDAAEIAKNMSSKRKTMKTFFKFLESSLSSSSSSSSFVSSPSPSPSSSSSPPASSAPTLTPPLSATRFDDDGDSSKSGSADYQLSLSRYLSAAPSSSVISSSSFCFLSSSANSLADSAPSFFHVFVSDDEALEHMLSRLHVDVGEFCALNGVTVNDVLDNKIPDYSVIKIPKTEEKEGSYYDYEDDSTEEDEKNEEEELGALQTILMLLLDRDPLRRVSARRLMADETVQKKARMCGLQWPHYVSASASASTPAPAPALAETAGTADTDESADTGSSADEGDKEKEKVEEKEKEMKEEDAGEAPHWGQGNEMTAVPVAFAAVDDVINANVATEELILKAVKAASHVPLHLDEDDAVLLSPLPTRTTQTATVTAAAVVADDDVEEMLQRPARRFSFGVSYINQMENVVLYLAAAPVRRIDFGDDSPPLLPVSWFFSDERDDVASCVGKYLMRADVNVHSRLFALCVHVLSWLNLSVFQRKRCRSPADIRGYKNRVSENIPVKALVSVIEKIMKFRQPFQSKTSASPTDTSTTPTDLSSTPTDVSALPSSSPSPSSLYGSERNTFIRHLPHPFLETETVMLAFDILWLYDGVYLPPELHVLIPLLIHQFRKAFVYFSATSIAADYCETSVSALVDSTKNVFLVLTDPSSAHFNVLPLYALHLSDPRMCPYWSDTANALISLVDSAGALTDELAKRMHMSGLWAVLGTLLHRLDVAPAHSAQPDWLRGAVLPRGVDWEYIVRSRAKNMTVVPLSKSIMVRELTKNRSCEAALKLLLSVTMPGQAMEGNRLFLSFFMREELFDPCVAAMTYLVEEFIGFDIPPADCDVSVLHGKRENKDSEEKGREREEGETSDNISIGSSGVDGGREEGKASNNTSSGSSGVDGEREEGKAGGVDGDKNKGDDCCDDVDGDGEKGKDDSGEKDTNGEKEGEEKERGETGHSATGRNSSGGGEGEGDDDGDGRSGSTRDTSAILYAWLLKALSEEPSCVEVEEDSDVPLMPGGMKPLPNSFMASLLRALKPSSKKRCHHQTFLSPRTDADDYTRLEKRVLLCIICALKRFYQPNAFAPETCFRIFATLVLFFKFAIDCYECDEKNGGGGGGGGDAGGAPRHPADVDLNGKIVTIVGHTICQVLANTTAAAAGAVPKPGTPDKGVLLNIVSLRMQHVFFGRPMRALYARAEQLEEAMKQTSVLKGKPSPMIADMQEMADMFEKLLLARNQKSKEVKGILEDGTDYSGTVNTRGEPDGHGLAILPNGGATYDGAWVDGEMHGKCVFTSPSGMRYDGDWIGRGPHGEGTLFDRRGRVLYKGQWTNGRGYTGPVDEEGEPHGRGVGYNVFGVRYEGDYVHGKREGYGSQTSPTRSSFITYTGEWADDVFEGKGVYDSEQQRIESFWKHGNPEGEGKIRYANGHTYEGMIEAWLANGQGVLKDAEGAVVYEGIFKEDVFQYKGEENEKGQPHGKGTGRRYDGCLYTGDWTDGKINGEGEMTYSNGWMYVGQWAEGERCGKGVMRNKEGKVIFEGQWIGDIGYEGRTKAGKPHGQGVCVTGEGDRFEGDLLHGMKHGHGTMRYADGRVYTGEWADGVQEGEGKLLDEKGTVLFEGLWKEGKKKSEE